MKQNFFVNPLLKPLKPVQKVFFFWDVEFALPRSLMTNQKRNLLVTIFWYKLSQIEGYHEKEHKILHKGRVNPPSQLISSMNSGPIPFENTFPSLLKLLRKSFCFWVVKLRLPGARMTSRNQNTTPYTNNWHQAGWKALIYCYLAWKLHFWL